jgi:hypothetical protein
MDPLRLAIALVPLAAYLLVIGCVNLRKRPLIVGGTGDAAAVATALSGLVIVGPLELFMPLAAAARFGAYVWCFLLAFYWLCASLAILMMRPRLVIYNTTPKVLRPILATVVHQLDPEARWAGQTCALPGWEIEFHLESVGFLRNVSIVGAATDQNLAGWRHFEQALRPALREATVERGVRGAVFATCAAALLIAVVLQMFNDPQAVALAVGQLLRP